MNLHELTIHQAHELLKKKEISAEELTRAVLDRIGDIDDNVDAFLTVGADLAMAQAGEADVIKVEIKLTGNSTYHFDVTVRHEDAGWKHYADKWDVVAPDGSVLGTRILYHPHVDEQPFTRSLSGVKIPHGIEEVTVRAHDSVHKYGGRVATVKVPR